MTNITVQFESGRDGGVMTRHQGKVAFPARGGVQPQVGDEYEVVDATPNARGTVYFLKLGRRISTLAEREEKNVAERQAKLAEDAARRKAEALAAQQQREAAIAASLAPWQGAGLEDERFALQGGDQGASLVYRPDEDEIAPLWCYPLADKTINQACAWKSLVLWLRAAIRRLMAALPDASREQVYYAASRAEYTDAALHAALAERMAFDRRLAEQDAAIERLIGLGWRIARSSVLSDSAMQVQTPPPAHRLIARWESVVRTDDRVDGPGDGFLSSGTTRTRVVRAVPASEPAPEGWDECDGPVAGADKAVAALHAALLGL